MGDIGLENFFWNSEKKITINHAAVTAAGQQDGTVATRQDYLTCLTVCMYVNAVTLAVLCSAAAFTEAH